LAAGLVQVEHLLVVAGEVDLVLVDERLEVEPLTLERRGAADPEGPDHVGRVPGGHLDGERVPGTLVCGVVDLDLDVGMARLEGLGQLLERLLLALLVAATETAEPGQGHRSRRQRRRRRGWRRARRSGRTCR